jgi:hypothetical protein
MPFKLESPHEVGAPDLLHWGRAFFPARICHWLLALASVLTSSCRNPMPNPPSNVCNLRDKTASREQNVMERLILCKKQAFETEKQGKLPI